MFLMSRTEILITIGLFVVGFLVMAISIIFFLTNTAGSELERPYRIVHISSGTSWETRCPPELGLEGGGFFLSDGKNGDEVTFLHLVENDWFAITVPSEIPAYYEDECK